ncbi:T9SS type A sorting domain-containing protein [Maribellus comscasis]|uniref:T9SS type A sorting domain-containing protein n=1 Tax=Maribellus comscasis TaxID=2681766 RepID=A0A6I6JUL1_9BACT|nr:T9SS type A sorting domain-containing protein [Maribellus comscasis]QGY46221.1 T9SS type A sorting domain-containing protein [Maribellus comscasis]
MKRVNLLFAFLLFFTFANLNAQNTYVPDDNFEQALIDLGYDSGELNDSVPTVNIDTLTILDVSGKNIGDLTGIEDFSILKDLFCGDNQLSSLDVKSNLALERLICFNNQLTNIDISSNSNLSVISCSNNQISFLNLSLNPKLTIVQCNSNQISSLDLSSNPMLTNVEVGNNSSLTSLNVQNGNNSNMLLYAENNPYLFCIQVDNVEVANNLTYWFKEKYTIYSEDCSSCTTHMTYVPDIRFERALYHLGYDNGIFNDSVPTPAIKNLKSLDVSDMLITDLTGIEDFESLIFLDCKNNSISKLDLSSNLNLNYLQCSNNKITELNLSSNAQLERLDCYSNQISELDVSSNSNLRYLYCFYNTISGLDLGSNTFLTILDASYNKLTGINLRNGNNSNMSIYLEMNPDLFCIQVDDPTASENYANWEKDEQASYSEDCGYSGTGVPLSEYFSLADLYNSTNGDNWTNNTNWLDTTNHSVADWYGITIENGHVTRITLNENNLQNSAFENVAQLPELRDIELVNNYLTGFNFEAIDSLAKLETLLLNDNQLIFNDILPAFSISNYENFSDNFYYQDQKEVDYFEDTVVFISEPFQFSISENFISENDQFQWYKNGEIMEGETNSVLNFESVTLADSSVYRVEITNPEVPDLTLYSKDKILNPLFLAGAGIPLSEYFSLADLYNSTNGNNWTNNTNWLDTTNHSVADWYGITIENGHVTRITLNENNLQNSAFENVAQLPELRDIELVNNYLTGFNFEAIDSLAKLDTLLLNDNQLIFNDILPAFSISNYENFSDNFYYQNQKEVDYFEDTAVFISEPFQFSISENFISENDQFQWYKYGEIMEGETNSVLNFESVTFTDSGAYRVEITNPEVPDLTLYSKYKILNPLFPAGAGIPLSEYKALEKFYSANNGENWKWNENWLDTVTCTVGEWAGVRVEDGHVRMLGMDSTNVAGALPEELTDLIFLEEFYVFDNNITGPLPSWIGELTNLERLHLGNNNLSGEIPASIGQLKKLKSLELSRNKLDGNIPSELGKATSLEIILMDRNLLSGVIPEELGNLIHLRHLNLEHNLLTGTIPASLGNLNNIHALDLSHNQLVGPLPVELKNLENIYRFDIDYNLLGEIDLNKSAVIDNNRQIPDELASLLQMDTLYLGGNQLQFNDIEAIFSWENYNSFNEFIYAPQDSIGVSTLQQASPGENLILFIENYFAGPSDQYQWFKNGNSIPGATLATLDLTELQLSDAGRYYCKISNPIATELTLYSRAITVQLAEEIKDAGVPLSEYNALLDFYNSTNGDNWTNNTNWLDTINHSVADWYGITVDSGHVTEIYFGPYENYNINGSIPNSIKDLTKLESFVIISDNLSGELPLGLFELTNLRTLYLSECKISGTLPQTIGNLINLERLGLEANNLEGTIPNEIGNLTKLNHLALQENNLTGEIPFSIGELTSLEYLGLSNNNLVGTIPVSIGNLTNLGWFLIDGNQITGPIPEELKNLENVVKINVDNNLIGFIDTMLKSSVLKSLTLSDDNRQIPDELSSLLLMDTLHLEGNQLQFNDIEAIFSWENYNSFNEFIYAPQDSIGVSTLQQASPGENLILFIGNYFAGPSDQYQWFKNGNSIPGATLATLDLTELQLSDAGRYYCKINNTVATELTLYSRTTTVQVTEKIKGAGVPFSEYEALIEIFDNFGGNNWSENTNWSDTINYSVGEWERITVENGHVTALDLSGLNLEGDISAYFAHFDSLKWLNLSNNDFNGIFTSLFEKSALKTSIISEESTLEYLNIANNKFVFADLEPSVNELNSINEFIYAPQAKIGNSIDTAVFINQNIEFTISNYTRGESDDLVWYKDGTEITGANQLTFLIENAALADSGKYTCQVTNSVFPELTLFSDTLKLSVLIPDGIEKPVIEDIRIYPNPGKQRIFVETGNKTVNIQAFNLAGVLILEKEDFQSDWIEIQAFVPGIYLFRIEDENREIINKKVIIK